MTAIALVSSLWSTLHSLMKVNKTSGSLVLNVVAKRRSLKITHWGFSLGSTAESDPVLIQFWPGSGPGLAQVWRRSASFRSVPD